MSDGPPRARRGAFSRQQQHQQEQQEQQQSASGTAAASSPASTANSVRSADNSTSATSTVFEGSGGGHRRSTASPSSGASSNAGDDEQLTSELKMRKSCNYCVRMKRACDGKTPCELCTRRNKECTRSVKKKSGPAKGTKYAARRARSQDEHGRSSIKVGGGSGSGGRSSIGSGGNADIEPSRSDASGTIIAGSLRRSASSGGRRSPQSSSSSSPANAVAHGSGSIHAPSHGMHRSTLPPELSFMQSKSGLGGSDGGGGEGSVGGRSVSSDVGSASAMTAGSVGSIEGTGVRSTTAEDLARHHQQGIRGGGDSESQQLISNFPGVLQDPSIWTSPSQEELRIVGDLETEGFYRLLPAGGVPPGQSADPRVVAHYSETMTRVTRAWDAADIHLGGRRATDGMDIDRGPISAQTDSALERAHGMRQGIYTGGTIRDGGSSSSRGSHDAGIATGAEAGEWPPRYSTQQAFRGPAYGDDQPHYFPRAFRRPYPQQQQRQQRNSYPTRDSLYPGSGYPSLPLSPRGDMTGGAGGGGARAGASLNSLHVGRVGEGSFQTAGQARTLATVVGGRRGGGGHVGVEGEGGLAFDGTDAGGGGAGSVLVQGDRARSASVRMEEEVGGGFSAPQLSFSPPDDEPFPGGNQTQQQQLQLQQQQQQQQWHQQQHLSWQWQRSSSTPHAAATVETDPLRQQGSPRVSDQGTNPRRSMASVSTQPHHQHQQGHTSAHLSSHDLFAPPDAGSAETAAAAAAVVVAMSPSTPASHDPGWGRPVMGWGQAVRGGGVPLQAPQPSRPLPSARADGGEEWAAATGDSTLDDEDEGGDSVGGVIGEFGVRRPTGDQR